MGRCVDESIPKRLDIRSAHAVRNRIEPQSVAQNYTLHLCKAVLLAAFHIWTLRDVERNVYNALLTA